MPVTSETKSGDCVSYQRVFVVDLAPLCFEGFSSSLSSLSNLIRLSSLSLEFRIDSGDVKLKEHIETADKNMTYLSKTTQNQLISATSLFGKLF